jgi:hypothetical protein
VLRRTDSFGAIAKLFVADMRLATVNPGMPVQVSKVAPKQSCVGVSVVGTSVGIVVGAPVGDNDGVDVGVSVVGTSVGIVVGAPVGDNDGVDVGVSVVGTSVGIVVGAPVGDNDGVDVVGALDGADELGAKEGRAVVG